MLLQMCGYYEENKCTQPAAALTMSRPNFSSFRKPEETENQRGRIQGERARKTTRDLNRELTTREHWTLVTMTCHKNFP